ncbi:uncharacterized protein TRIADDRAFT_60763 [Trichoplax adhaerens]|uniref:Nucleolar protein 16 n=1 Tax=Trichoplax adhaerens TaxID=10228 RepID=B3S8W1_TRIAD|nr:hypothetical protein TRIADDRAFT_60763 [Trichoplax adhaerens]EDV20771.1 hypothetical protein TRIADDRAFT_60763 [Trichoplax adhaerens]|eukprot:XP_002116712.1 hypothetical protein TRIADDRAFT_60763 [Trichoplax adhaerens]
MAGVRRKKTQRNKRPNSTAPGRVLKRKAAKVTISNNTIKKNWNKKKTLRENFSSIGLAINSNKAIKIRDVTERMEVDQPANPSKPTTKVVQELEMIASQGSQTTRRHIAPGEVKFLKDLMDSHGENYEAMARDKRNCYQQTAKQLERKCKNLMKAVSDGIIKM